MSHAAKAILRYLTVRCQIFAPVGGSGSRPAKAPLRRARGWRAGESVLAGLPARRSDGVRVPDGPSPVPAAHPADGADRPLAVSPRRSRRSRLRLEAAAGRCRRGARACVPCAARAPGKWFFADRGVIVAGARCAGSPAAMLFARSGIASRCPDGGIPADKLPGLRRPPGQVWIF